MRGSPNRQAKKKPGEFKAARKRHLAAQARSDALKRLKEGEPVEVTALHSHGVATFQVRPLEEIEPCDGQRVLCVFSRKLRVMWFTEKDGCQVLDSYHQAQIPMKQILGIVTTPVRE